MTDMVQPWIRDLLDVTSADVVYSFSPDQFHAHDHTARQLIPSLIADDVLSSHVGICRSHCDEQWFLAAPLSQGGSPLYCLR